jgi:ABC-type multidrug transport system fused ATPase/permease subunit
MFETILEKYKTIPVKYRNDPKFVEIERNLDINSVSYFISSFIWVFSTIYSVFLSFLAISFIEFNLFFVALLVGGISLYFNSTSQIRNFNTRDESQYNGTLVKNYQNNFFHTNVNTMSDNLVINNNFKYLSEKYKNQIKEYLNYNFKHYNQVDRYRNLSLYLLDISAVIILVLVYLKGIDGAIAVGTLGILISSYQSFTSDLNRLGSQSARLIRDYLEIKSINDLLEFKIEEKVFEKLESKRNLKIEFINVSFKYPTSDNYVLKNVNLTIEPGDKIGIIGQNGAGKSTLVKLLFRLYEPTEGVILINGQNIYNLSDEDYFSLFKILSQDQNIESSLTIKEIIHLGNSQKKLDMKKIKWAAKMSGVDQFIKDYKDGYDQLIGRGIYILNKFSEKKFVTPSPGQERRIQIAKIFYAGKPVVILDEPTSNVDPISSKQIFENLNKLPNNEILILIAHDVLRLNNVVNKIVVMKDGEMVEYGDRKELIENRDSEYYKILDTYNSKNITIEKE